MAGEALARQDRLDLRGVAADDGIGRVALGPRRRVGIGARRAEREREEARGAARP
jgi:hypothetical protein